MANLPADLVDDIILRLPVKSLLRFRSVSKPWLSLIDSPYFIKVHLNRLIKTRNNSILVLTDEASRTYSINVDSPDALVEIDNPWKSSYKKRSGFIDLLKGSCNGLILISYWHRAAAYFHDINFIWNPSTRNYHKLPFAKFDSHIVGGNDDEAIETVLYGIGFDSVHDDYKVVRMIMFYNEIDGPFTATEVKVYSLKSNTWRRLEDFPYYLYTYRCHGVFYGGALHWLVTEEYQAPDPLIAAFDPLISAFDVATEEYRLIPMPPNIDKFVNYREKIEELEGCLSICNPRRECIDLWAMKCYGVKESWIKLISVDILPKYYVYPNRLYSIVPLALSKDGRKILLMHSLRDLIWVDLQLNMAKRIDIHGLSRNFLAGFVTQSLVPLYRPNA